MLKKNLLVSMLAVAGLMIGATASAQNVYVGGTVGQSKWMDDCKGTTKCDTTGTAYKILGGYNLDKNFAIEASAFSLGKISATNAGVNGSAEIKGSGFDLSGVVKTNFTEEFGGFAKLGLSSVTTKGSVGVSGIGSASHETTSTQPVLGLGVSYKLTKELALVAEFETRRVKLDGTKESVRNFSVGAHYSF